MVTEKTVLIFMVICLASFSLFGAEASSGVTVEKLYPNLAVGVLAFAKIEALSEGVLLKADGVEISSGDLEKAISKQPVQLRPELAKNAFFVLEQEATVRLLNKIAVERLSKTGRSVDAINERELLQDFFQELTKDVKVANQDIEKFYKDNKGVLGGAPLEKVRSHIELYILQDKKQKFIDRYIQTLGEKIEIKVSDSWARQQAAIAKDNPIDKARNEGKPTLVICSAASCCGPDKMMPVKQAVQAKYDNKISIVYITPNEQWILAARYGLNSIPSFIIFDSKGKEYFRHNGFLSEKALVGKFTELGVE